MKQFSVIYRRFLIWRIKNITDRQFTFVLCILIGVFAGLAAVALKTSVHYIEYYLTHSSDIKYQNYLYFAFPLVGIIITVFFVRTFIKDDISHGVSKILYTISKNQGVMKRHNLYSSMVSCTFTGGFGGSVGMEAPILSTGAAIGSNLGQLFQLNRKTKMLLVGCGAAAAMSAIFKAPIAGLIFALEVLMIDLTTASIIPLLIASVTGAIMSTFLLGERIEFYFTLRDPINYHSLPFYALLGVFSGIISVYFTRINRRTENALNKIQNPYTKVLIGGLGLGILIFFFPPLFGEGYGAMKHILSGNVHNLLNNSLFYSISDTSVLFIFYLLFILLFKVIATAITTGSGGVGGIFAPSLFMGGITGLIFARGINLVSMFRLSESNFALVGMAGLISGVIHAPLTAIFLIAEITGGYELFIPLIVTASLSFLTVMYFEPHSVYTKILAERGELLTHHKDQVVLTLLNVKKVVETNFTPISPEATLGDLVKIIAKSRRNIYPVVDRDNNFLGLVPLDEVREIMFEKEKYHDFLVREMMVQPPVHISLNDPMESVMKSFTETGLWNLPVVENGKYVGFVSRANVFNSYRKLLIEFSEA